MNVSFSGFPFPKIPRPWWRLRHLNQQFKENTFAPLADNEGQWRQLLYLQLCDCSPVWARIYISVNRVFTHLFEWPCKVSNPCFTMNKYINNEISSVRSRSIWKKESETRRGTKKKRRRICVWLGFHRNSKTDGYSHTHKKRSYCCLLAQGSDWDNGPIHIVLVQQAAKQSMRLTKCCVAPR